MTPLDVGQEQPIPDLGNLNDLEEGKLVCYVFSQEQARDVLGVFSWLEEEMSDSNPKSEEGIARKDMFERALKLIHKRIRYEDEYTAHE